MALIKCPECNKEVSDKAVVCIHCGYPLQELIGEDNLDLKNSLYFKLRLMNMDDDGASVVIITCKITGLRVPEASTLVEKNYSPILIAGLSMEDAEKIKSIFQENGVDVAIEPDNESAQKTILSLDDDNQMKAINYSIPKQDDNDFLFCPRCRSKLVETVSVTSWGLIRNVCSKCGYEWKPGK